MTQSLTILLPLKGRHLHTIRFLYHANLARLPHHFLIADGAVHPAIAAILENAGNFFPNLEIEYVRYPDDETYTDFYRKMADAASRVKTRYVMQADNDDFLMPFGIGLCQKFLDENPAYVACGAEVGGFALHPAPGPAWRGVTGDLDRLTPRYMPAYAPRDDAAPNLAARILAGFDALHTHYYSVFRAETLVDVHRELLALDLTDLHLHEVYFGARAVTLGKARRLRGAVGYMRQGGIGTPISSRMDWAQHLIHSRYTNDLAGLIGRLEDVLGLDQAARERFERDIRPLFARRLRVQLEEHYQTPGESKTPPLHHLKMLAHMVLPVPLSRRIRLERSRRHVLGQIGAEGTAANALAFAQDWDSAERVMTGVGFADFVRSRAPALLRADAVGSAI